MNVSARKETRDRQNPAAWDVSDAEDIVPKSDAGPAIRLGFWVLVVGFGLFMSWAAWAPLDEGVAAPATVSVETHRKVIQHMQGGVIQQLAVKEGAEVRQGDLLIVLDESATRAGFEAVRQNYLAQRALEARLLAELTGAQRIEFHKDLLDTADAIAAQHVAIQQQMLGVRRSAQGAEIAAARQSIAGLEGQIEGLRKMLDSRGEQARSQGRQLANVQSLADDGFAPRNQALQLEQSQSELKAGLADLQSNIHKAVSTIAETRLRIAQREQEYLKEVSSQLADVRREVQANQERLAAMKADLGRTSIRSPINGQVIALTVSGVGGVVTPGQRLMDILPHGEPLLLDVKVPPHAIDRLRVGESAEVRFSAFANTPQLAAQGKVVSLSGDSVVENTGLQVTSYYLARVALTEQGLKTLGSRVLQPGMTAEVLIKTGERPLLSYLLHPLSKRVAAAMTEE